MHPFSSTNSSAKWQKKVPPWPKVSTFSSTLHKMIINASHLSSYHLSAALSPETSSIWEGLWENVTPAELLCIFSRPHASLHLTAPPAHTWERLSLTALQLSGILMLRLSKKNRRMHQTGNLYLPMYWNKYLKNNKWTISFHLRPLERSWKWLRGY